MGVPEISPHSLFSPSPPLFLLPLSSAPPPRGALPHPPPPPPGDVCSRACTQWQTCTSKPARHAWQGKPCTARGRRAGGRGRSRICAQKREIGGLRVGSVGVDQEWPAFVFLIFDVALDLSKRYSQIVWDPGRFAVLLRGGDVRRFGNPAGAPSPIFPQTHARECDCERVLFGSRVAETRSRRHSAYQTPAEPRP